MSQYKCKNNYFIFINVVNCENNFLEYVSVFSKLFFLLSAFCLYYCTLFLFFLQNLQEYVIDRKLYRKKMKKIALIR